MPGGICGASRRRHFGAGRKDCPSRWRWRLAFVCSGVAASEAIWLCDGGAFWLQGARTIYDTIFGIPEIGRVLFPALGIDENFHSGKIKWKTETTRKWIPFKGGIPYETILECGLLRFCRSSAAKIKNYPKKILKSRQRFSAWTSNVRNGFCP